MLRNNGDWNIRETMLACEPAGKLDRVTILYGLMDRDQYADYDMKFIFTYDITGPLAEKVDEFCRNNYIHIVDGEHAGITDTYPSIGVSRTIRRDTELFKAFIDYIKEEA